MSYISMYALDALSSYIYSADEKRLKAQSAPNVSLWPHSSLCLTTTEVGFACGMDLLVTRKIQQISASDIKSYISTNICGLADNNETK